MSCLVKICGLSEVDTLLAAVQAGADYIGFVHFPKSPRHVTLEQAATLRAHVPSPTRTVLVLVNPTDDLLSEIPRHMQVDFLQLHGKESPQRVAEIKSKFPQQKLIKALPIAVPGDLAGVHAYLPHVDMLLFDAKPPTHGALPGGNGVTFDWSLLNGLQWPLPWMLSGGLTLQNIDEAVRLSEANILDVSSGVEITPGKKNIRLIEAFVKAAHS